MDETLRVEFNRKINAEFVTIRMNGDKIHLNAAQALSLAQVLVAKLKGEEQAA